MSATAKVINFNVAPLHQQAPQGSADFSPLLGITHATASNTIQCYLGGFPTTSVAAVALKAYAADGSVQETLTTVLDANGTSATYTSGSGDAWIATAGKSFNLHVDVTLTGDTSAPGGSAINWVSGPVLVNVV